jgi:hypothetical protein
MQNFHKDPTRLGYTITKLAMNYEHFENTHYPRRRTRLVCPKGGYWIPEQH